MLRPRDGADMYCGGVERIAADMDVVDVDDVENNVIRRRRRCRWEGNKGGDSVRAATSRV